MDNLVILYHGGSTERDDYGNVKFVGMQNVLVLFNDRPSFSEFVGRTREELHWYGNDDNIVIEGVLHLGSKDSKLRRIVLIGYEISGRIMSY